LECHLTGAFPRSEKLVEASRAAVRGKISKDELELARKEDVRRLVELQRLAGLDYVVDGQLNWQDLFRPFSELFTGIQPGSLTRWFDNNTFYRKPTINGKVTYAGRRIEKYFSTDLLPNNVRKKAVLPGPFTFAAMSKNTAYRSFSDLVDDIAHSLAACVKSLASLGYEYIQFNEPFVGYSAPDQKEVISRAFDTCLKGVSIKTAVHTYFADVSSVIDTLLDLPTDSIGIDLYCTSIESLSGHDFDRGLGSGCIDGRNSLLETVANVRQLLASVVREVEPKFVYACPNCDLDFLPEPIAEKKVQLLSEIRKVDT